MRTRPHRAPPTPQPPAAPRARETAYLRGDMDDSDAARAFPSLAAPGPGRGAGSIWIDRGINLLLRRQCEPLSYDMTSNGTFNRRCRRVFKSTLSSVVSCTSGPSRPSPHCAAPRSLPSPKVESSRSTSPETVSGNTLSPESRIRVTSPGLPESGSPAQRRPRPWHWRALCSARLLLLPDITMPRVALMHTAIVTVKSSRCKQGADLPDHAESSRQ